LLWINARLPRCAKVRHIRALTAGQNMIFLEIAAPTSRGANRAPRRWWGLTLCAFVLGLVNLLLACSPTRTFEAIDILEDIAAGPGPSHFKRTTIEPSRRPIAYDVAARRRSGDLYVPARPADAALVLVPGLAPEGKDDPRLVAFARTLARARFCVLVPDIPSMRNQKVRPSDTRDIADAIIYLGTSSNAPPSSTLGVVALSYSVGPAILATLQDDAHDHVAFIVTIGGYFDIEAAIAFFTTGYFREPRTGEWQHRAPNEHGKWIFARSNVERLALRRDRDLLGEIAERKMANPKVEVDDLVARLGPEGRAVYALLVNGDPAAVPRLIAALPPAIKEDIAALDLRRQDLSRLPPRLILVHGRDDAIIPASESEQLARAAADRTELYLVDSLTHVDLGISGISDTLTLLGAVYQLLAERDAIAESVNHRGADPQAARLASKIRFDGSTGP
jgi:pimeloyl-ACP methyl ester carboxylesterase